MTMQTADALEAATVAWSPFRAITVSLIPPEARSSAC